mmetsp:Transcript_23952/g.68837  ORF Transcript_23952/g.68837 Transcript_23952/m.68837 type:complete len:238 (-) Transcript_23952:2517-3230(-)
MLTQIIDAGRKSNSILCGKSRRYAYFGHALDSLNEHINSAELRHTNTVLLDYFDRFEEIPCCSSGLVSSAAPSSQPALKQTGNLEQTVGQAGSSSKLIVIANVEIMSVIFQGKVQKRAEMSHFHIEGSALPFVIRCSGIEIILLRFAGRSGVRAKSDSSTAKSSCSCLIFAKIGLHELSERLAKLNIVGEASLDVQEGGSLLTSANLSHSLLHTRIEGKDGVLKDSNQRRVHFSTLW